MSYDIYLVDPKTKETIWFNEPCDVKGGTYVPGGTTEAWLNITYNYGKIYYEIFGDKGIRAIYGKTGEESIPLLEQGIGKLQGDTDPDYWKPTEGNAKAALLNLIKLAKMAPHGIWNGD